MAAQQWKLDILRDLRHRNKREIGGFSDLIASRKCMHVVVLKPSPIHNVCCVCGRWEAPGATQCCTERDHSTRVPKQ